MFLDGGKKKLDKYLGFDSQILFNFLLLWIFAHFMFIIGKAKGYNLAVANQSKIFNELHCKGLTWEINDFPNGNVKNITNPTDNWTDGLN